MLAGARMKLIVLYACGILGLTGGKFCHVGWSGNEADCLDVLVESLA
jgi:hypothetical protein